MGEIRRRRQGRVVGGGGGGEGGGGGGARSDRGSRREKAGNGALTDNLNLMDKTALCARAAFESLPGGNNNELGVK